MEKTNFKDWTLTKLDKAFGITQILEEECERLKQWENLAKEQEITEIETLNLLKLQKPLKWGGRAWNEFELENKFISPVMMEAQFDDRNIGYFLERKLSKEIGEYELSGIVDGMIATGFREPDIPFFCMQEFKKSMDNPGRPDAQALAAMLVAKEMNENKKPIYGMYVVGLSWNFMILDGKNYCISKSYNADDEEVFMIFKILKALKHIINTELLD